MPLTYSNKGLRRAILETLAYAKFLPFAASSILAAIRPEYPDLTEPTLMGEVKYLERKGYVETENAVNFVTKREAMMIVITAKGIDLLEGSCTDVGIECAK
jgi:hypothetical protein